jgi:hypothetical protein
MKEVIDFKQQRDIGAIITDVFKFIRVEGKTLGLLILKISGPAMLAMIASYVYYAQSTMGEIERIFSAPSLVSNEIFSTLLLLGSYTAFYALLSGSVFGYIKNYIENNGNVNENEVAEVARNHFWSYIGLNLVTGLMVIIGLVLCFLPGIYLAVCLSLSFPMMMFERRDMGYSINNSFKLIKEEWWITFATLIVLYILYSVIAIIFQLPQIIYYLTRMFTMMNEVSRNPLETVDWIQITMDVFSMIAQYFLFALFLIGTAFVYFHLNEKKNFTGTLETIDRLGERENDV